MLIISTIPFFNPMEYVVFMCHPATQNTNGKFVGAIMTLPNCTSSPAPFTNGVLSGWASLHFDKSAQIPCPLFIQPNPLIIRLPLEHSTVSMIYINQLVLKTYLARLLGSVFIMIIEGWHIGCPFFSGRGGNDGWQLRRCFCIWSRTGTTISWYILGNQFEFLPGTTKGSSSNLLVNELLAFGKVFPRRHVYSTMMPID